MSLEQTVLRLQQDIEENRRAASNIIRLGVVERATATTVDIQTGDNHATRIPFFVHCAGRVSHYRRPSSGEQCLLINLGSGDNLNNAVALMGLPSDRYPCPTTQADQVMTDYGGGMTEQYDLASGRLTATYPGGMTLKGDIRQTGAITSSGDIRAAGELADGTSTLSQIRTVYNDHTHSHDQPPSQKME